MAKNGGCGKFGCGNFYQREQSFGWRSSGMLPLTWFNTTNITVGPNGHTIQPDGNGGNSWSNKNPWSSDISTDNNWSLQFKLSIQYHICGVAKSTKNAVINGYSDIDYAYSKQGPLDLYIYENGALGFSVGPNNITDTLKIESIAGVVKYYVNGVLKYTSLTAATNEPYKIKDSIYEPTDGVLTVISY